MPITFEACFTRALVWTLGSLTNSINVTAITSLCTGIWNPQGSDRLWSPKQEWHPASALVAVPCFMSLYKNASAKNSFNLEDLKKNPQKTRFCHYRSDLKIFWYNPRWVNCPDFTDSWVRGKCAENSHNTILFNEAPLHTEGGKATWAQSRKEV